MQEFYDAATSGLAIEMLLNRPDKVDESIWNRRVMGTEAARSVVERKTLVQTILTAYGSDLLEKDPNLSLLLLSIGSGWGRLPLDVMTEINRQYSGRIRGFLVDKDPEAVMASCKLARTRELDGAIEVRRADIFTLRNSKMKRGFSF